jgi:hypothetical protein
MDRIKPFEVKAQKTTWPPVLAYQFILSFSRKYFGTYSQENTLFSTTAPYLDVPGSGLGPETSYPD